MAASFAAACAEAEPLDPAASFGDHGVEVASQVWVACAFWEVAALSASAAVACPCAVDLAAFASEDVVAACVLVHESLEVAPFEVVLATSLAEAAFDCLVASFGCCSSSSLAWAAEASAFGASFRRAAAVAACAAVSASWHRGAGAEASSPARRGAALATAAPA